MKKNALLLIFFLLVGMVFIPCYGQTKKMVAIYVARGNGDQKMASYAKFFASELQLAVSRSAKYNAVERTGKFLELLSREQSYQRSGQVDESKIAELGRQEGVDFVLSVDMTDFGNNSIYVVWKLIDVETAIVEDGESEIKQVVNMVIDLKAFSESLTKRITGGVVSVSGQTDNAVYYLVADYAILKSKGLVRYPEAVNLKECTEVYDMNELEFIETNSGSCRILTEHPSGSYKFDAQTPKNVKIKILNPKAFWNSSRVCLIGVNIHHQ